MSVPAPIIWMKRTAGAIAKVAASMGRRALIEHRRVGSEAAELRVREVGYGDDPDVVGKPIGKPIGQRGERRIDEQDCDHQAGFSQTETCCRLSLVNGSRFQPAQRSRRRRPASSAIRSSSAGQT